MKIPKSPMALNVGSAELGWEGSSFLGIQEKPDQASLPISIYLGYFMAPKWD